MRGIVLTNKEVNELLEEVRTKGRKFTNEEKRALVLKYPAQKVADSLKVALQYRWNMGPPDRSCRNKTSTEEQRHETVLGQVREMVDLLMPDHEEKAREIYALVPWPVGRHDNWQAKTDFAPVPTFEKFMGQECATCGGTGVTGFLVGRRCWDC